MYVTVQGNGMHCDLVTVLIVTSWGLFHNECIHAPPWSHPSLHPTLPILATGSGQRKFPLPRLCLDAGSEDSSESESGNEDYPENCDNSLKLWVFQQGVAYPAHDSAQCTEFEDVWRLTMHAHDVHVYSYCMFMACVFCRWSQMLYTKPIYIAYTSVYVYIYWRPDNLIMYSTHTSDYTSLGIWQMANALELDVSIRTRVIINNFTDEYNYWWLA